MVEIIEHPEIDKIISELRSRISELEMTVHTLKVKALGSPKYYINDKVIYNFCDKEYPAKVLGRRIGDCFEGYDTMGFEYVYKISLEDLPGEMIIDDVTEDHLKPLK